MAGRYILILPGGSEPARAPREKIVCWTRRSKSGNPLAPPSGPKIASIDAAAPRHPPITLSHSGQTNGFTLANAVASAMESCASLDLPGKTLGTTASHELARV